MKRAFEALLQNLGTDYIDIGMIHYVDSEDDWRAVAGGPVMAYAQELQRAGRVRHIGVSSHNPRAALHSFRLHFRGMDDGDRGTNADDAQTLPTLAPEDLRILYALSR